MASERCPDIGALDDLAQGRSTPALTCTPMHPRRREDEALTSLVLRSARANGVKPLSYAAVVLDRQPLWSRDPDRTVDEGVLAAFGCANLMPVEDVRAATLPALAGRLFPEHNPVGSTRWLLPLGVWGASRRRAGNLYCPACLAEDVPYYRLSWRLAYVTFCPRHGALLHDACPACDAPVAYHRRDLSARLKTRVNPDPITLCWRCRSDLASAPRRKAPHPDAARIQDLLTEGVRSGEVTWDGHTLPILELADVVHQVIKLAALSTRTVTLRERALTLAGVDWAGPPPGVRQFEHLRVADRHAALALAGALLPSLDGFLDACAWAGLTASRVTRDMSRPPAWFVDAVEANLGRKQEFPNFMSRWERGRQRWHGSVRP